MFPQFSGAMLTWGVVTTCSVAVQSYGSMMALRVLIGCAEAMIQGAVFYLSFWYKYDELAFRGAIMYSTSALAGSFNGLISYSVQLTLDGKNGWSAWRWIFLIEGIVPIGWSFVVLAFLPATPESARFGFSPEEKAIIVQRSRAAHNTGESKILPKLTLKPLLELQF